MGERHDGERPHGRRDSAPGAAAVDDGRRAVVMRRPDALPASAPEAAGSAPLHRWRRLPPSIPAPPRTWWTSAPTAASSGRWPRSGPPGSGGAHRARTRRRDDWRPREHGRVRRSLRVTTLCCPLAGLTLGGVAYAAIGSATARREAAAGDRERSAGPAPPPVPRRVPPPRPFAPPPTPPRRPPGHGPRIPPRQRRHGRPAADEKVKGHGKAALGSRRQQSAAATRCRAGRGSGRDRNVTGD